MNAEEYTNTLHVCDKMLLLFSKQKHTQERMLLFGATGGTRTPILHLSWLRVRNPLLYPLSYSGILVGVFGIEPKP